MSPTPAFVLPHAGDKSRPVSVGFSATPTHKAHGPGLPELKNFSKVLVSLVLVKLKLKKLELKL